MTFEVPEYTEETIFTWGAPPLKFGAGAIDEVGFELSAYDVSRVLIVTDPGVNALGAPQRLADNLSRYGIESEIFDGVHVEPTDDSMNKATEYARAQGPWDGFVAVGGGSAIDTAKAINLLTSHPGELMDYINKPIGGGKAPGGGLKPLIAVPTTAPPMATTATAPMNQGRTRMILNSLDELPLHNQFATCHARSRKGPLHAALSLFRTTR